MLQIQPTKTRPLPISYSSFTKSMIDNQLVLSKEDYDNKYEVVSAASRFDPTQCSPPNSFIDNLKKRMDIYYK